MSADAPRAAPTPTVRGGRAPRALRLVLRHPRRVVLSGLLAALLMGAVLLLVPLGLSPGGYVTPGTEATRADAELRERFGAGLPDVVLRVRTERDADDPAMADAGLRLVEGIAARPGVRQVFSYWTERDARLLSRDRRVALVTLELAGTEADAAGIGRSLVPELTGRHGPLDVSATGAAWVSAEVSRFSASDLVRAELIGVPLVMLVLWLAFGSVAAALLAAVVGGVAVAGTLAALRLVALVQPVSVFAPNIATALGFGLAVDYALFVVTRYRDEFAAGAPVREATVTAMRTTGHAVLFSAGTIVLSLLALFLFPLPFLRSLAVAGVIVVSLAAAATMLLLPAALLLLGERVGRRRPRRNRGGGRPARFLSWTRIARVVTARPLLLGTGAAVLLGCLLLPFTHVRFGPSDARVLPRDAESHAVARKIDQEFALPWNRALQVVLPRTDALADEARLDAFARRVSTLSHVAVVEGVTGTYRDGRRVSGPVGNPVFYTAPGATWLEVVAGEDRSKDPELVDEVRALRSPGGHLVSGEPARHIDTQRALAARLPWAAGCAALAVTVLLFLLTGSLVLPLKAIVVGVLSLGASFGAVVFVFQDGHLLPLLGADTATGELIMPVMLLMFAIAFGLSVDYEVFMLSRVTEEYARGRGLRGAVVAGVAGTSRVISLAALVVALALLPLVVSRLTILKMLGLGLALAVLVDATLVRGVLVPAAMCLLGRANWWAPAPLARWHRRFAGATAGHLLTAASPAPPASAGPTERAGPAPSVPAARGEAPVGAPAGAGAEAGAGGDPGAGADKPGARPVPEPPEPAPGGPVAG
ncbi:MMPL family transporter [Streptomyces sp. LP05-1]|uniref:MMPL family transporter n=1 Tax=Streptomyces pyxinae TaxID=2970734 RepID=A0ABT2C9U6_9ACTN|nr:MMPL family transporter [Streptomyces sp. LP05-1]MCS0634167.1 MMPL family transporter [Streptomyces sp. LP05-1]